jgi:HAE1 family hydrophobic/amphiphilic exporter-1
LSSPNNLDRTQWLSQTRSARLAEIQLTLPQGFHAEVVGDQSIFIKAALESIERHLVEGGLLAAIVVFIFYGVFVRR